MGLGIKVTTGVAHAKRPGGLPSHHAAKPPLEGCSQELRPPAPVPHTQRKARGSLRSVPPPCAPGSAVGGARHRKPTSCHLPHNACPITPGTLRIHDSECQKGRPRRDSKNEALTRLRISFQERFPSRRGRAPPDLLSGVRPRAVDSTPSKEEKGSRGGTSPVRRTPGL